MIKKLFIILLILCLPSAGWAATYTVTQSGGGADYSVATFNNLSGTKAGDTFYFSGSFSTRITVFIEGSAAGQVTLDGYQAGDCDPLNATCTSSADLTRGISVGNQTAGPDYITIQDFRMTNQVGDVCFLIYGYQAGNDDQKNIDHSIVRRNYIGFTNSTMFWWYSGRYNIIEGNKFVHFGQNGTNAVQGINFIGLDNTLITSNEFGHDEDTYPSGCVSANMVEVHHSSNQLWEYNDIYGAPNQAGISFKESGVNHDIVVRFNKFHHHHGSQTGRSWDWGGGSGEFYDGYFYGNFLYNNDLGAESHDNGDDAYYWSNIIVENGIYGMGNWDRGFGDVPNYGRFYNNTFARNGADSWDSLRAGLTLIAGSNFIVENNIFYNNRPNGADGEYHQIYVSVSPVDLQHNTLYHGSATATWWYAGAVRSLVYMQANSQEEEAPAGVVRDPLFSNPDGDDTEYGTDDDDYTLQAGSLEINAGKTLTGSFQINLSGGDSWFETNSGYSTITMDLNEGLDPGTTNWTTTPPTVGVLSRDAYGWSRGAYVFKDRRRIFFVD